MGESHFVAMKLVMLSCLLVIAAYAAPATFVERDSLVPEEILLQNYNSVADLQAQFGQLKAKLADSSQSTPGVKAAIDNMITMVGTINTAIKEAHKADQGVLDSKMTIIKNLDDAFTVDLRTVNDAAKVAQNLIAKQQRGCAAKGTTPPWLIYNMSQPTKSATTLGPKPVQQMLARWPPVLSMMSLRKVLNYTCN